jgi:hypothetical protein
MFLSRIAFLLRVVINSCELAPFSLAEPLTFVRSSTKSLGKQLTVVIYSKIFWGSN